MAAPTRKTDDPAFREWRARKAANASHTNDAYIRRIVDRAPSLTAEQIERLRGLLPPVEGDDRAPAA